VSSLKVINADLPLRLSVRSSPESVRVTRGEIVPLALIVNELIMNAIKHSRGTVGGDPVEIVLESTGNRASIAISTHGGRFPGQFDFATGAGLGTGLALVKSLLPPAGAELRFANLVDPAGTKVELTLRPPVVNR
jgi:two-component sensor histidine kinase